MRPPRPDKPWWGGWGGGSWGGGGWNTKSGKGQSGGLFSPKSGKGTWHDPWAEEGVWAGSSNNMMSMDLGTPSFVDPMLAGSLVKPKSSKTAYILVESDYTEGAWVGSKSAKSHPDFGIDYSPASSEDSSEDTDISIKVISKTGKAAYVGTEQLVVASKSAKSFIGYSQMSINYPQQEAHGNIKVTSKTGKGAYLIDGQVVMVSKSAKSAYTIYSPMSNDYLHPPAILPEDSMNGIKAKTGKGGELGSKGSKTSVYMSVGYSEESWITSKSAKGLISKSAKSTLYSVDVIITPEEAGLPFRAKSSKTIPIHHIYSSSSSNSDLGLEEDEKDEDEDDNAEPTVVRMQRLVGRKCVMKAPY